MVNVGIERDEEGRVRRVSVHADDSAEGLATSTLVEATVLGLRQYLHLDPTVERDGLTTRLGVDRSDFFLDREIDAVVETMVLGLRHLAQTRDGRVAVDEVRESVRV